MTGFPRSPKLVRGGLVLLAYAEGSPDYVWLALALVIIGLGIGLTFTLTTDAVMASVPKDRAGAASAISETAYELGVALGIALLGSLQVVIYRAVLSDGVTGPVRESLASASNVLAGDPSEAAQSTLAAAQHAFSDAMQITSLVAAVLLAVAAVVAWRVIPSTRTPRVVVDH